MFAADNLSLNRCDCRLQFENFDRAPCGQISTRKISHPIITYNSNWVQSGVSHWINAVVNGIVDEQSKTPNSNFIDSF